MICLISPCFNDFFDAFHGFFYFHHLTFGSHPLDFFGCDKTVGFSEQTD
jgi:hypothetical protein